MAIGGLFSVALSVGACSGTAQALPGSVPAGARTFLEHLHARDHPADSIHYKDNPIGAASVDLRRRMTSM